MAVATSARIENVAYVLEGIAVRSFFTAVVSALAVTVGASVAGRGFCAGAVLAGARRRRTVLFNASSISAGPQVQRHQPGQGQPTRDTDGRHAATAC